MDAQVNVVVRSCHMCQLNDKTGKSHPALLQQVLLAVDIFGPFDSATSDYRFAITLTDYYSKWLEMYFTHTVIMDSVVSFLSSVFSRHKKSIEYFY